MSEPLTSAIKCDKCEQGSQVTWEAYHAGWYHCESRHWGFTLTRCPRHTASSVPASDVQEEPLHEAIGQAIAETIRPMLKGIEFTQHGIAAFNAELGKRGFCIVPAAAQSPPSRWQELERAKVYQAQLVAGENEGAWRDVDAKIYDCLHPSRRRILFTEPPPPAAAPEGD